MSPVPTTGAPAAAWQGLREGNARFVADLASAADRTRARRVALAEGQRPSALVLGCSDSRVPAEIVFDQGLGDLFVVRTAGHVVDAAALGSVEFGVQVLGISLVVVLGHEACGAVAAAVDALEGGTVPGGWVRDLVERITPSALAARARGSADPAAVGAEHVRATARLLTERSLVVAEAVRDGRAAVVGATYELTTGHVTVVDGTD